MTRRILCGVLIAGTMACAESPATPTAPSTFTTFALAAGPTTEAFAYYLAPDDAIRVEWQEIYHRWAVQALDVQVPRRIRYNKYHSRAHMEALIGVAGTNAFADAATFAIHTIWDFDCHEVVHLYSSTFGRPVALWSEGLAVAFHGNPAIGDLVPRWNNVPIDDVVRRLRAEGRLVPIAELRTSAGFRRFPDGVTYPESGSFVRFVLATCGLDGVKRIFSTGNTGDTADSVSAQFEAACGRSLESVEQAWLAHLDS
jgi:hypothetical protein